MDFAGVKDVVQSHVLCLLKLYLRTQLVGARRLEPPRFSAVTEETLVPDSSEKYIHG